MKNDMKYFISAPFGNYVRHPNVISVTGTWTMKRRKGLAKQILRTLRYVRTDGHWGWRNKIGLRNAGIVEGLKRTNLNDVCSIAAIDRNDWIEFSEELRNRNLEVNISCPNLGSHGDTTKWRGFELIAAYNIARWCIVKIPPTASFELIDDLVYRGYRQIHASNTLPSDKGGLSGKILIPYTLNIIEYVKKRYSHVEMIAGGGVTKKSDVKRYIDAGADHVSLGSVCFTPWKVRKILSHEK